MSNHCAPLVSIIIPVYNGANYLGQAIDSALNQTYKNIEIIVVDDGSNDNGSTKAIANAYGERIHYYYKENGGTGAAINYGISLMHGEYVSWLSHDDLYKPDKIEKQVAFAEKIKRINKCSFVDGLIYSYTESIDANGKTIFRKKGLRGIKQTPQFIFSHLYNFSVCGCATLIPKQLINEIGLFDERKKTTQDVDYWYRIALGGHCYYCLEEYLVKNRRHKGQTSNRLKKEWLEEIELFEKELLQTISNKSELTNFRCYFGVAKYIYIKGVSTNMVYVDNMVLSRASGIQRIIYRFAIIMWRVFRYARMCARSFYRFLFTKKS